MDRFSIPLVLTKLRVPAARQRMIPRPRLVDLLRWEDGQRLLLVCAPAGYGKTTLLAEWARSLAAAGTAVAWVSLDPGDDDPCSFGAYLAAAFIQALGPIPELVQIERLLRSAPEIDLQRVLPGLINAVVSSGRNCVLVLDDYHLISSPAVHSGVSYLLEHLPENLRVAAGSRSDPPLPLGRLRARGQLREIRTAGLRFTAGEAARFLNEVMLLDLSEQGIALLEERTEGWAAGLQLAALSILGRDDREEYLSDFGGSQRHLVEYLMEEVFNHQPEAIRSFLLDTAVLERMHGVLCDALTGETQGADLLRHLEQANLFVIALDERGEWYRYHHLFRDFLLARLQKTRPDRIPGLHRAACEWLAGQNLLTEAARHAFLTGDREYAAEFVEAHSFTLIIYSEIATIYEWCTAFPEEVMQRHPMLCLLQGLALAYGFRRANRERVQARLKQADRMIAAIPDRETAQGLVDMASVVRTFMAFAPDPAADPHALLALAGEMTGAYPDGSAAQFSGLLVTGYACLALNEPRGAEQQLRAARQIARQEGLYFGMVESSFHLARLYQACGRLREAADTCREARDMITASLPDPGAVPALGSLDVALGCVRLEQDDLEEAGRLLRQGLEQMGGGMNPYYLMAGYLAISRLYEIQSRADEAQSMLDRLEAIWPDLSFCTQGLRARYRLRNAPDDPAARAEAAGWALRFSAEANPEQLLPGLGPLGAAEAYYLSILAWAEIQIALGSPRPALACLQRLAASAEANGLGQRMIEVSLLLALGWRAEGDDRQVFAALARAVDAAAPQGYARIFDQGPALAGLLAEAARRGLAPDFIESVLKAQIRPEISTAQESAVPNATTLYGESLSERELEVLRLIAGGASNQEVAERLVITIGTVKSHMNHILGKLDARNRTEAVARARAQGLLEV